MMAGLDQGPPDLRQMKAEIGDRGFCIARTAFSIEEIREAEAVIDSLMHANGPITRLFKRELAEKADSNTYSQPELVRPAMLSTKLRRGAIFARCRSIASYVLGRRAHYLFDHAIYKMPCGNAVVPWHQDQAYLGERIHLNSVHFWIPFQDTSEVHGAMRYADGSHKALVPHHRPYKNNPHVLSVQTDPTHGIHQVVLSEGDAAIHTHLTVHQSGPNQSDEIRKAWVLHFGDRPAWYKYLARMKSILRIPLR